MAEKKIKMEKIDNLNLRSEYCHLLTVATVSVCAGYLILLNTELKCQSLLQTS